MLTCCVMFLLSRVICNLAKDYGEGLCYAGRYKAPIGACARQVAPGWTPTARGRAASRQRSCHAVLQNPRPGRRHQRPMPYADTMQTMASRHAEKVCMPRPPPSATSSKFVAKHDAHAMGACGWRGGESRLQTRGEHTHIHVRMFLANKHHRLCPPRVSSVARMPREAGGDNTTTSNKRRNKTEQQNKNITNTTKQTKATTTIQTQPTRRKQPKRTTGGKHAWRRGGTLGSIPTPSTSTTEEGVPSAGKPWSPRGANDKKNNKKCAMPAGTKAVEGDVDG